MKSQKIFLFIAAIAFISMAFIPKSNSSSEESELFSPQWGTITSVDTVNGCMTIEKCGGGSFSFGIFKGVGPGSYPSVGTGIIAEFQSCSSCCNGLFLIDWTIRRCRKY